MDLNSGFLFLLDLPVASSEAAFNVRAKLTLSGRDGASAPRKQTVQGFSLWASVSMTRLATDGDGGLEISTMWRVAESASSMASAASVLIPPTGSLRSRPPTPRACETPYPACAIRLDTSCMPVPDAPMIPIAPCGIWLAKASGTPPMMAVPQSGPMTNNPAATASRLSETSSESETLSLNSMTFSPARRALRASAAAKSPGTEIRARFAAGRLSCAERNVLGRKVVVPVWPTVGRSSRISALASALAAVASSRALMASIRSPPVALRLALASSLALSRRSRLDGVPIMRAASSTPSRRVMEREICISITESRNSPVQTRFTILLILPPAGSPVPSAPVQNKPEVL